MNKLTPQQIEELSNTIGAKKLAVENFLMSLDESLTMQEHMSNCALDSEFNWNPMTAKAIVHGIKLAYKI